MTAIRPITVCWGFAVALCLPACLSIRTSRPVVIRESTESTAQPSGPTAFASLIRAPGERVSLHDPHPTVIARSAPNAYPLPEWPTSPQSPKSSHDPFTALTSTTLPTVPKPPSTSESLVALAPVPRPVSSRPDPPLVAAVRDYVNGQPERAVEHLKALDRPNQELMLQLIPAVVRASQVDLTRASPTEMGLLAEQLRAPAEQVAARAPLILDRVCFCRWVKNFGRYEPLPEGTVFHGGSLAELYVEVRNVPSVAVQSPGEGAGYVTKLTCTLQVFDAAGAVVPLTDRARNTVPALTETKRDFTRSPIRDYFLLFRFPLPERPGLYEVAIKVHDPEGGREVSRTVTKVRVE